MTRVLRRPMFRTGGTAGGITSGLQPRQGYKERPGRVLPEDLARMKMSDIGGMDIGQLQKLSRSMSIVTGLTTIFCLVVSGHLFASEHLEINHAFTIIPFIFSISILCILYIRTFIFRLNLELVELNHILIDSDKYFIFKYTLPIYIVIQVVSGFGFLIMIFK